MDNENPLAFTSEIEWEPLDLVIRGWIALTGFEKDQSDYQKMKEQYQ